MDQYQAVGTDCVAMALHFTLPRTAFVLHVELLIVAGSICHCVSKEEAIP